MTSSVYTRIENGEAVVGVVGLGYVGLPLLLCFAERGFRSVGFDIDERKTTSLRGGVSYIKHISSERILKAREAGKLDATGEFRRIADCDAVLIAVPTPLTKNREPDLTFIVSTCKSIAPHLHPNQLISLESTTYPGTTEEVCIPLLEAHGLKNDKDFFMAYSPEREDPGRGDYTTGTTPKVVAATSPEGLRIAEKLYQQITVRTVPVSSTRTAEATKLMENIFRSVNIALVNELKMTFMRMGINVWEVIEAATTKPFGYTPFYPGPGLGGHCIPIDPFYLTWKAREYGVTTKFIELAGEINTSMPDFVVHRVMETLNGYGKAMKGSRVLLLGLAYKGNVDDDRESPSYRLMEAMEARGAEVAYHDPFIPVIRATREFPHLAGRKSVEIRPGYDVIVLATPHDVFREINYSALGAPIVDTRNIVPPTTAMLHRA